MKLEFIIHFPFRTGTMDVGTKPGTNAGACSYNSSGAVLRMPAMMSAIRFQLRASW
jgi:hypothetical protein